MYRVLNKEYADAEIENAIQICKSDSRIEGAKLRKTHEFLGETLAIKYENFFSADSVLISFLRAGIPFSYGFANIVDCAMLFYNPKQGNDFFKENESNFIDKDVFFIDSVINSGNSMLRAIRCSNIPKDRVKIITNVLCTKALDVLKEYDIFTVRISENSYRGEKVSVQKDGVGPDTGSRLFRI